MKPPKTPFWAWNDIGEGAKWHLCIIVPSDDETPMMKYLVDDFEDYWYDDDWDESQIKKLRTPEPLE